MYSELIVMVMKRKVALSEARRDIEQRQDSHLFQLSDAVLVCRDAAGELSVEALWQDKKGLRKGDDRLAGVFAGVIFDDSEAKSRRRLVDAGLDPRFLSDVNQALNVGDSVCLIYVPQDKLVDTRRYLLILGQLQGELYHTIFRSQLEEALLSNDS